MNTQIAIFAAGCFWGVEETFRTLPGVLSTEVGYSGGNTENPTYKEVCSGKTGHAECIKIEFDPSLITYEELLKIFWKSHNPTTPNRQGPDVGTQYRSAVFYLDLSHAEIAKKILKHLEESKAYHSPIVTEITPAAPFYRAEEYHQKYCLKNGVSHCSYSS
jgi:peptide-methionine (S)-S-oxide reductase